jgi:hypothetical protein
MNLDYAVDRLYESGWFPVFGEEQYEALSDGRQYPSVDAIRREFESAGLTLNIKHNMMYNCHRATWAPAAEPDDAPPAGDARRGTVVGSSEHEAAVFALAQFRESTALLGSAMA